MLMWQPAFRWVSDASRRLPYRFEYRVSSLTAASPFCFSRFSLEIFVFFGAFSLVFSRVLGLFCPLVHFISFPSILLHLLHFFQYYLTVNHFNILEYILR
jgi:hypothetical protein